MRMATVLLSAILCPGLVMAADDPPREPPPIAQKKASPRRGTASASDIDRLTTYATILGRAIGCGMNVDAEMKRVGRWMDRRFPPGTERQRTYLPIFLDGIKYHARQQKDGKSPDSCETVKREVRTFPWP